MFAVVVGAVLVATAGWADPAAQVLHQEVQGPLLLHQGSVVMEFFLGIKREFLIT